ncbi:coiled-coil domain-containing protein 9B isoform X1 [Tachysurus fulvidraco]|uniref:coiled-coil domain-containing protein 9B isoform X1 n=3 Tax=Tachysurus fulvidraco TaxID=1234273 RepID=UPI000F5057F2|nr:coiled-coil domain-containing protein 9B isoform X1 [Tachysurus fulvidraco]
MAYYIQGKMGKLLANSGLYDDPKYSFIDPDYHINIEDYFQNVDIIEKVSADSATDMILVKKEQKDAELDRKIEALRKKNEALMKRYQEVEEDKKRAEQEGMAMQSRKGKVEDLTITINKFPTEKRVVTKKDLGDEIPKLLQNQEDVSNVFSVGRGKRRQILVTAPGNTKGKRVVSERVEKGSTAGLAGIKHSTEGRRETLDTTAGRKDCTKCPVGKKQERKGRVESAHGFTDYNPYHQQTEVLTDLSVPTSSDEQLEYLRWKKEREEIDRERVARHKNSKGQWRRAWDMDKPELTFSEKGTADRGTPSRGGRNARRGQSRPSATESRGAQRDKRGKNVPVVCSKVRGKDRLTGRARRWDAKDEEEHLLVGTDTSLEEFLEELDALCDPEVKSNGPETETQEAESAASVETATNIGAESQLLPTDPSDKNTSVSRGAEKKVRFSDDLIHGAAEKNTNTDVVEIKASSLKSMPLTKTALGELDAEQDLDDDQEGVKSNQEQKAAGILLTDLQAKTLDRFDSQETSIKELKPMPASFLEEETESNSEESPCDSIGSQNGTEARASTEQNLLHTMEPLKNNPSRNSDELIDSSLSVLSLESGNSLPDHSTSTEKARENGKVV